MADFLDTNGLRLLWTKIKALVIGKADKVANAVSGNFAGLDSNGNLTDSGYKSSDFLTDVTIGGTSVVTDSVAVLPLLPDANTTPKVITVPTSIANITSEQLESLRIGDSVKVDGSNIDTTYFVTGKGADTVQMMCSYGANGFFQFIYWTKQYNNSWVRRAISAELYVPSATSGNLAGFNSNKMVVDSGYSPNDFLILVDNIQPIGGMLPNTVYNFGVLQNDTTFVLAAATDNTIANVWRWTFIIGSTVPTITWPSSVTWVDGNSPTILADKYYEIRVHNGYASVIIADAQQ